jgi:hypothetical protein
MVLIGRTPEVRKEVIGFQTERCASEGRCRGTAINLSTVAPASYGHFRAPQIALSTDSILRRAAVLQSRSLPER